jgi:hypothetical protein
MEEAMKQVNDKFWDFWEFLFNNLGSVVAVVLGAYGLVFVTASDNIHWYILLLLTALATGELVDKRRKLRRIDEAVRDGFGNLEQSVKDNFDNLEKSVTDGFSNSARSVTDGFGNLEQSVKDGFDNLGKLDPKKAHLLELIVHPDKADVTLNAYTGLKELRNQFWDSEMTQMAERTAAVIWVATPELRWESDSIFGDIIGQRIKDGDVHYYELYLNTQQNQDELRHNIYPKFTELNPKWLDFVKYIPVDPNEFVWYAEHVLYSYNGEKQPDCIIVNMIKSGRYDKDLNISLPPGMRKVFMRQFENIWNNSNGITDKWEIKTLSI